VCVIRSHANLESAKQLVPVEGVRTWERDKFIIVLVVSETYNTFSVPRGCICVTDSDRTLCFRVQLALDLPPDS
jgi:hypothetical protein